MNFADYQYNLLCNNVINNGIWIENERTKSKCLTGNTTVFTYNVSTEIYPIITTRKAFYKSAIAEVIGYWKGITNAQEMSDLGSPTWFGNSNENKSWLNNTNRKGKNDMGFIYGAIGHDFGGINQFKKVVHNLSNGIDDRGEIITYWKPDEFYRGSLRPCMHSFQFNLVGNVLDMTAIQRSCDIPLGLVANMQQCYIQLALMARITGLQAGVVTHVINNPHIYENQLNLLKHQMSQDAIECTPKILIPESIKTFDDIMNLKNVSNFKLVGYEHQEKINYEFTS